MTAQGRSAEGAAELGANSGREPTVQQLRTFLVLAEELHFGRAAGRLFLTQPALSQQLRALERRLDVRLVERSRHHVGLTAAGEALLPKARAVVETMSGLCRAAGTQARGLDGRLRIGSVGAEAAMPYTRAILDELHTRHPHLRVTLCSLDLATHFEALERGDIDVMFLRPPVPPGIETLTLATEPRVACLPATDPLAARDAVTLAELADRPVADVRDHCPPVWWKFWSADPRPDGTPVRYGPPVTDMEGLLLAVSRGQTMAFLPAAARDFFPRPGVSYVDVPDLPPGTAALAWAPGNRDLPTVAAVRHAAAAVAAR